MKTESQWYSTTGSLANMKLAALRQSFRYYDRFHALCEYLNPDMPGTIFCLVLSEINNLKEKHDATWELYQTLNEKEETARKEPFSYTFKYADGTDGTGVVNLGAMSA